MKTFVVESSYIDRQYVPHGWGNGYVLIDSTHPYFGKEYNEIEDIEVHGGLTYSEQMTDKMAELFGLEKSDIRMWCFGFDTVHFGDNEVNCSEQFVREETERLKEQLIRIQGAYYEQYN